MNVKAQVVAVALWAAGFAAALPQPAATQAMPTYDENGLASLARIGERLQVSPSLEPIEWVRGNLASQVDAGWAAFQQDHGAWSAQIDGRSGRIESAEGRGIP